MIHEIHMGGAAIQEVFGLLLNLDTKDWEEVVFRFFCTGVVFHVHHEA